MRAGIVYAALLANVLAAPAFAADVTVRNFAGTITLVEGNDGVDVIQNGSKGDLEISDQSDAIVIDGGLSRKQRSKVCDGGGFSWDLSFNGRRSEHDSRLKDYPTLEISIPVGTDLNVEDSTLKLKSDVTLGQTDLDIAGCFDTELTDTGDLSLDKSGSGDFTAGRVGHLVIEKSGSGDTQIDEALSLDMEQSGSGELDMGPVRGFVRIDKSGSSDVSIRSVDGPVSIHKSGSGDVEIHAGRVTKLDIESSGSGDIDIRTSVEDAHINASGSGDVHIKSLSGALHQDTSGSADVTVGDD